MAKVPFEIGKTPNPNARRVGLGEPLFEKPVTYRKASEAAGQPLVASLLALPGVVQVFAMDNFITVTKQAAADWAVLEPALNELLEKNLNG